MKMGVIATIQRSFNRLQSVRTLQDPSRNSCVDVFRALAIVAVVLFHFEGLLPYGNIGVDLFFVISGLLVGGLLIRQLHIGTRIRFFKFFLQRGFKIWPSYYAFLLFGSLIAFALYHQRAPEQVITGRDWPPFLFFYMNYVQHGYHWSFEHLWSLCVEEHFYILLPIAFLLIQRNWQRKRILFIAVFGVVLAGILFKLVAFYFTHGQETYVATHNRIDALAWGVLLALLLQYFPDRMKQRNMFRFAIAGLLILSIGISIDATSSVPLFRKVILHSLVPFGFFLLLAGLYHYDFSRLKVLRFVAYYSYNWYLWHLLFIIYLEQTVSPFGLRFVVYLAGSFMVAVFFTIFVEEPLLRLRKPVMARLFKPDSTSIKPVS